MALSKVTSKLMVPFAFALLCFFVCVACAQAEFSNKVLNESRPFALPERQISRDVIDCKSSNELVQAVCQVALALLNKEVSAAGIMINRDELLFNYNDGTDIVLRDTCSSKTEIRNTYLEAKFRVSQPLNVMGNLIFEPLVIPYRLPVTVRARLDAKQRFGRKLIFTCLKFPSDDFRINGHLDTDADVVVGLLLRPLSFTQASDGNYELRIRPDVVITFNLENTDLKFDLSGVSFLSSILGTITGFLNTPGRLFQSVVSIFRGDRLSKIWKELITDLGFLCGTPAVLGVGLLPANIEQSFYELFDKPVERQIEKKAKGFGEDIEDKLNKEIGRVLKVGPDGTRTIHIKENVVDLLKQFGVDSEEFFLDKGPSGGTTGGSRSGSSSGGPSSGPRRGSSSGIFCDRSRTRTCIEP